MTPIRLAAAVCAVGVLALAAPALAGGKGNSGGNGGGSNSGSSNGGGKSGPNGNSGTNSGSPGAGNGDAGANSSGGVVLLDPCVLAVGGSCLFQGNINLDNKLPLVDDAYNGQAATPTSLLNLGALTGAEQTSGFSDPHSGTITSSFLVSYFAVKAGDFFRLYEIAPTYTFNWSTAGLLNGGGQEPTVSHVVWFDPPPGANPPPPVVDPPPPPVFEPPPPTGPTLSPGGAQIAVPEPAAWTLMIMGIGGAGAMLRRARRQRPLEV
jgi:hypothetical protein